MIHAARTTAGSIWLIIALANVFSIQGFTDGESQYLQTKRKSPLRLRLKSNEGTVTLRTLTLGQINPRTGVAEKDLMSLALNWEDFDSPTNPSSNECTNSQHELLKGSNSTSDRRMGDFGFFSLLARVLMEVLEDEEQSTEEIPQHSAFSEGVRKRKGRCTYGTME
jgi:hypothetical protein